MKLHCNDFKHGKEPGWRYLDRFAISEHFYKNNKRAVDTVDIRYDQNVNYVIEFVVFFASIQKQFVMQTIVNFINEMVNANMTQFDGIIDKIVYNMHESSRALWTLWQFNFNRIEWICVNLWMYLGRTFNADASARPGWINRLHFDAQQLTAAGIMCNVYGTCYEFFNIFVWKDLMQ